MSGKTTLGLIVGNRGFFPSHLCKGGRAAMMNALKEAGLKAIALGPKDTEYGAIESLEDARKCATLFDEHRHEIDGIVVTLPNFGDERAVANAIRWSGLRVPVLIHAFPDEAGAMTIANRRDSFCGKMSVCNNLLQSEIPFTLTSLHTVDPASGGFKRDLADFAATCRVVKGLRCARIGALGARPAAFKTVRFSEKLLENSGITVETLDLFELFGRVERLADDDKAVKAKIKKLREYVPTGGIPDAAVLKMAKFGVGVDQWVKECDLHATAIQCWTAMEEFFGVVPCACMSMMSNALTPSACEVDVMGAVAMYAMTLASGQPSALVDWNNNYGEDPDKAVIFHCSNLPKDVFMAAGGQEARMDYQEIIAGSVGKENAYGTIVGRMKTGPFSYLRVATDEAMGCVQAYIGEGELTGDQLDTFGGYGVARIPRLQDLLRHICENGFEHHVAVNLSQIAGPVNEALGKYLGWDVYLHD